MLPSTGMPDALAGWYQVQLATLPVFLFFDDRRHCRAIHNSSWTIESLNTESNVSGREEALTSGQALKQAGLKFDLVFTSLLKRAHQTLDIVLQEIEQTDLSVVKSWKLNERHYGGLTGLNKADAAAKYGDKQVQIWRRSYNVPPPVMEEDHPMNNVIVNNPKFSMIRKEDFPKVESLEMTQRRVVAFWTEEIVPHIKAGKKVLVVAHGTSLRSLVKYLEGMIIIVVVTLVGNRVLVVVTMIGNRVLIYTQNI
ncbi:unnamed protein product [Timema podura]|uniref:phosphoglycerate mutase (2,3-diphosphoglycerate-dependent) n=1 Tax=Timema podura TaxID=61482 RepID=A0ABN7P764_TIMPD|nr:unnamed protein product [Timema podura]